MDKQKFSNNADVLICIIVYALVLVILICGVITVVRQLVQEAQGEYRTDAFQIVASYLDRI